MERLTGNRYEDNDGYYVRCSEPCEMGVCIACKNIDNIVDRLGQIEDILGDTYELERLRELIAADRAGKVMILPVKPGEYIYLISLDSEIVRRRVGNIAAEEWGTSFEGYVDGFGTYRTGPNDKVFFSCEAAEAALAKEADHE